MEAMNKKKVLVTGASGFVGSTLATELARQGHEVRVLVRKTSKLRNLEAIDIKPVVGDLRDPASLREAVRGVDTVFHVAGVISSPNRETFFLHNAEGTENMARAAAEEAKSGALGRFVYVSSLAAAGPPQRGKVRNENETPTPISNYGASKLAGEAALKEIGSALSSVVVRPPSVYGPRDRGIFTFFDIINKGVIPLLGLERPDPRRYSFVHVDDLVRGIIAAGFASGPFSPGELFYVSGDGEYSWEETMEMIAQGLEKKGLRVRLPIFAMRAAGALCSGITKVSGKLMPLSLDKVNELEAIAWTCSNEKAKQVLGFKPYWGLEKGLRQTARWYREHGWL